MEFCNMYITICNVTEVSSSVFAIYVLTRRRKYSPVLISGTLSRVPRPGTQKDAFVVLMARFVTLPRDARGRFF